MQASEIRQFIKDNDIDSIRVDFSDLHGINRGKIVPAQRFEEIVEEGITCAQAVSSVLLNSDIAMGSGVADEVGYGDMKVVPDLSTFAPVPYLDKTIRLIGDPYVNHEPWPFSPRNLLKRVLGEYAEMGLQPIVASELEFYIFKMAEDGTCGFYSDKPCNVYTMSPRVDPQNIMRKLQVVLTGMGYDILYYNHEFFQGQYEFNWKHTDALLMADQTFTFKNVCKEIGHMENLLITFMGRPRNDAGGSGFHMHFSMNDAQGTNTFDDPGGELGMSDTMRHFIGGVMQHAKASTALLAPTVNSYKRFQLDSFAPYFIGWGLDNRTVYLRVPSERGAATRIEVRAGCASANPYLAIAAMLITGLEGIRNKIDPGKPFEGDLYRESEETFPIVPLSLFRALHELQADERLCSAVGPKIIQNFLAIKNAEIELYRNWVSDWEFTHYSYHL
ncbi:glutamine synthetase family protein [Desulfonatronum thioautotrophicum]|uniref:glutamine synthetase family protein n=1 Tax=Desulfonatronum thioautotrophicum TaxID=617001 RepID=UPI0005EBEE03|nr:glutamine synthetase family protein [Desulfonatronum thioautotrophicum]